MSLLNLFKLEKLSITAYGNRKRLGLGIKNIEAMFNPTSYKSKHAIAYYAKTRQGLNTPGKPAHYSHTPPGEIEFQLILDGTGVNYMGVTHLLAPKSVKSQIADFMATCYKMNADIHQPNYLKIRWGDLTIDARLKAFDITYKLFDESGDPLRAELTASFVEDQTAEKINRKVPKSSPDLTHLRVVKSGDTLPLLCKEIYGSSLYYLRVAADNGLEDFRNLKPGQKLRFAPLDGAEGPSGA